MSEHVEVAMSVHVVSRTTRGPLTTIECQTHGWSIDCHPADRAWAEGALDEHVAGGRVYPPLRVVCHAACFDEHGHTDGCLYDGDDG